MSYACQEIWLKLLVLMTISLFPPVSSNTDLHDFTDIEDVQLSTPQQVDPNGYIAYCPCMGRFGNQADQFLGALAFAERVNRTLILPPWVEYIPYKAGSLQIPFSTYFDPNAVLKYHRVVTMEEFMNNMAPLIWPKHERISFCYAERKIGKGCDAKEGNPFGPFWDSFEIDFVKSEIFGPDLHYLSHANSKVSWAKYKGNDWPVLAFVGPPSVFPVEEENTHLQEYLVWNNKIESQALEIISNLPKGRFVGIHLRNGIDWVRACEHIDESRGLFSSPQCTGYRNEHGRLTPEVCLPSTHTIIHQVIQRVKLINATSVYVASDHNHLYHELSFALGKYGTTVHRSPHDSPHVDLAVLGKSNLFIGNCVSSFSAFVKRERDVKGLTSNFWAFPEPVKNLEDHNEL